MENTQDMFCDQKGNSWNPMMEDYTNSQFNQYSSGPGANLDPSLQPAAQQVQLGGKAGQHKKIVDAAVPYLVFKHLPKEITTKALLNICSRHGRVLSVRSNNKNDYFFVDLASVADMEAVYRALEHNTYGFRLFVGKQYNKNLESGGGVQTPKSDENCPPVPARTNNIDMSSRSYRASDKNPARFQLKQKPLVSSKSYAINSLLQQNDPKRQLIIEDDAHNIEREGLHKPNVVLDGNKKYNYTIGQAHIRIPDKTKHFIDEKHHQSLGQFNATDGKYYNSNLKEDTLTEIGKCSECQQLCDIVCSRCRAYFCGLLCQQKAWPKHRYVCGKPKETGNVKMQSPPPSKPNDMASPSQPHTETKLLPKKAASRQSDMPRSGNLVTLTSISKTNVVFIRSKTYEDNLTFFKTVSEINAIAKNLEPLSKPPQNGQIVVAEFEGQFNRAMVINVDDLQNIKLVYMDYGSIDKKALDDLKEAPEHFVDLPRLAIPVILKDVPDCYMTDEIRKFMYSYLDCLDMQVKYKVKEDFIPEKGVHRVELIDEATSQSFNKMIATLSKPVEPTDANEVIFRDYLTQKTLPVGKNISLVVMDNSLLSTGCISCSTEEYAFAIQKFQRDLQIYAESLAEQSYAPRLDELCLAKYTVDQRWYRGRCLDLVGDGHPTIVFFDYGNIALVNVKDIRRYPPQFTFPIYTADCEIEGLPEYCHPELVEKLEELIPNGSTIHCDQVEVFEVDKFHSLTMPKIMLQLKADGLLEKPSNET